jgi:protease II
MAGSAPLQRELLAESMARLPASDRSTPQRQGGFWYYSYRRAGGAYRVHCRCARGPTTGPAGWLEPAPAGSRARAVLSIRRLCAPAACVGATCMHPRVPACALHVHAVLHALICAKCALVA